LGLFIKYTQALILLGSVQDKSWTPYVESFSRQLRSNPLWLPRVVRFLIREQYINVHIGNSVAGIEGDAKAYYNRPDLVEAALRGI
jgi:hypothetical protein